MADVERVASERARLLAVAAMVLAFAAQAGSLAAYRFIDSGGPPTPDELLTAMALGVADVRETNVDQDADERGFLVPAGDWVSGQRADLAPLVLWVDGRAVPIQELEPKEGSASQEPPIVARLIHRSRRDRLVRLYCRVEARCTRVVVARMSPTLRVAVAAQRLRRQPRAAAAALALLLAGALIAYRATRGAPPGRVALLAGLALAGLTLWSGTAAFRLPSAPVWLAGQALLIGAPLLARPGGEAARVVAARLAPLARAASVAIEDVARSTRLSRWGAYATALAALLLWWPVASTDRAYFSDWANHLYYVARQAQSLGELLHPSYFLHTERSGVFYPYFAFYGGTLYVLTATLALVLRSVPAAYAASFAAAFAMAYGGVYWLCRQLGVGRAASGLPGLVLVSSAYYLTNAYGRGAWAETLATSAIPLLLAAAVALLRQDATRPRDAWLLVAAGVVFSGSHTITLVWGSVYLSALLVLLTLSGMLPRPLAYERLLLVVGLLALAVSINGWFLLPALAYASATGIGGYAAHGFGSDTQFLNTAAVVFHPGRFVPSASGTPGLYVQVPIYALLWSLLVLLIPTEDRDRPLEQRRRLAIGMVVLLGVYLALLFTGREDPTWQALPRLLKMLQFQFRLHTYVTLAIVGLVTLGLERVEASRSRGLWLGLLVAASALQLRLAAEQIARSPKYGPVSAVVSAGTRGPDTFLEAHDYRFRSHPDSAYLGEPVLAEPRLQLRLDPAEVVGDTLPVALASGDENVLTNLVYSPFVRVEGDVALLGRTAGGWAVLAPLTPGATATARIVAARPWPVVAGVGVTGVGALGVIALLARIAREARKRRRAPEAPEQASA